MNPVWLLPEYVEDILPPQARAGEQLRRRLLDLFDAYGYDLIIPPLVEYLESLLTGAARDLDLKTFKVVDALSGRMLGVRADMTPQAARIDAHLIGEEGVTRLCYAGPVLRTKPAGLACREPFQIGAELFGHAGIEADLEIQELLLAALHAAGLKDARLSLGHAGIFKALAAGAGLGEEHAAALFTALRGKDVPEVEALSRNLAEPWRSAFCRLPGLYGGIEALQEAHAVLPETTEIHAALDQLETLFTVGSAMQLARISVDLSDLRGDGYHNGATFAAYAGGQAGAVALGGRYDGAGAVFGRARAATGFSLDLRQILDCLDDAQPRGGIAAPYAKEPYDDDAGLRRKIAELRAAGERVIVELPGQSARGCERRLEQMNGEWAVVGAASSKR